MWLTIPKEEESIASALGALHDKSRRQWYIEEDMVEGHFEDFEKWYQPEPYSHIIFEGIYALEDCVNCPSCSSKTPVICLFSTDAEQIAEGLEPLPEHIQRFCNVFSFIGTVEPKLHEILSQHFPYYSPDKVKSAHTTLKYFNHCTSCGAVISDMFIHEFGSAFHPEDWTASNGQLYKLDVTMPVKLSGNAGHFWQKSCSDNRDLFGKLISKAKSVNELTR